MQLLKELYQAKPGYDMDEWKDIVAKELGVFDKGKYNFAHDLKSAYHRSLKTNTETKILEKIPDHFFWDIKAPQLAKPIMRKNRYNPFRGREFDNFFEIRASEEYMNRNNKKENIDNSTSLYRRY